MKIKKQDLERAIDAWLFESYPLSDTEVPESEEDAQNTVPSPQPIIPQNQTAQQLSKESHPIDDDEWVPQNTSELGTSLEQLVQSLPDEEVEWYYRRAKETREKAIERSNKPDMNDPLLQDTEIQEPIKVKNSKTKLEAAWLRNLDKLLVEVGVMTIQEARWKRSDDYAYKWKQGQPLELHKTVAAKEFEDFVKSSEASPKRDASKVKTPDQDPLELEDDEFIPDVDDLRDFMEEFPDADVSSAPGFEKARKQWSADHSPQYSLEDLIKSKAVPSVKGPSGMRQWEMTKIHPFLRSITTAPKLVDELLDLVKSDYALEAFFEAMLAAKLFTAAEVKEMQSPKLKKETHTSEMYKYFFNKAFVQPAMGLLKKVQKASGADPLNKRMKKLSKEEAKAIRNKVEARWGRMTSGQKANDATRAMQANLEFLSRDTSVAG